MAGAVFVFDLAIIFRALVGVFNQQRNRRAGGHLRAGIRVFKHAGENFHRIGFAPLRGELILPGLSFVEPMLNIGLGQRQNAQARRQPRSLKRPRGFRPKS